MNWITENPFPPVLLGIIVEALLVVALMKTGKRLFTWLIVAVALLVAGSVVAEQTIVTAREEIDVTLEEARKLVEANQPLELLSYIDPAANQLRNNVQIDLASLTVEEAVITDLDYRQILVTGDSAKVRFHGRIRFRGGSAPLPLEFRLDLRKSDGRWLITNAEYSQPTI